MFKSLGDVGINTVARGVPNTGGAQSAFLPPRSAGTMSTPSYIPSGGKSFMLPAAAYGFVAVPGAGAGGVVVLLCVCGESKLGSM